MAEVSRRVPWRNGGGWTSVLAQAEGREPAPWRISVAEIERDGPFSDYSGYDRTIVAEDAGFTLEFADGARAEIHPLVPYSFAGERAVFCRLHGARATAFNVITLRGAFTHEVRVERGEIVVSIHSPAGFAAAIQQKAPG
ncbi:MAG TPA: HutD family protein [Candidatus Baltobacteraceae bacterium]|nr:HutD family protein [Candidatus Baltobacteraceae bacterium]